MIKTALLILFYGLLVLIAAFTVFYFTSPQFGASQTEEDFKRYSKSEQFKTDKFYNTNINKLEKFHFEKMDVNILKEFIFSDDKRPENELTHRKIDKNNINNMKNFDMVWFGHSTFLLKMNDKKFLFDPMFSERPSPVPFFIDRRYSDNLAITPEELPEIDAVFISHDHYDHLDYDSIQKLKEKTKMFYVPLGVGKHLTHWNVEPSKITEMVWWEENNDFDGVKLVLTPSYHFSGRKIGDSNHTLWGSWLVKTDQKSVYFSGDTGYADHFKEIQKRYGDIDFALLECGQYNVNWKDIHMMPEETAQAGLDLGAKNMMPVHWGAFTLSVHKWNEPVERFIEQANKNNQQYTVPELGEIFNINENYVQKKWW